MTDITLLDGSMGQELVKRSGDRATPLWSTQVMIDHADLVADVHRAYLDAGATVLSTNSYAVHRSRLERVGLADAMPQLLDTALTQAETARAASPTARIAGCIGPLMASYRPDLDAPLDLAKQRFGEIAALMEDRVDLFLIETVSSLQEAEGALRGFAQTAKPTWIAFTVDDQDGSRLRSGEALTDALGLLGGRAAAVLINCSRPEVIGASMGVLATHDLPFGAYANGFDGIADGFLAANPTVDALEQRQDLGPASYANFVMSWIEQGATIVGGCCEIGPAHIAEIANRLRDAGHRIV